MSHARICREPITNRKANTNATSRVKIRSREAKFSSDGEHFGDEFRLLALVALRVASRGRRRSRTTDVALRIRANKHAKSAIVQSEQKFSKASHEISESSAQSEKRAYHFAIDFACVERGFEARLDVAPGAHVGRLLLTPHNLGLLETTACE